MRKNHTQRLALAGAFLAVSACAASATTNITEIVTNLAETTSSAFWVLLPIMAALTVALIVWRRAKKAGGA